MGAAHTATAPDEESDTMLMTDEHHAFRAMVREFVEKEINPHIDGWEAAGMMPLHDIFSSMAALGMLGRSAKCTTARLRLLGADGYKAAAAGTTEGHLGNRYGTLAAEVQALVAADPSLGEPLVAGLPYLRAEAVYAVRHEMATTLDDVLTRRTRARLQDRAATVAAAPAVAALIAPELGWDDTELATEVTTFVVACIAEEVRP